MEEKVEMKFIARYHCGFADKFGLPRQSGIVEDLPGKIIFEPKYRNIEAFRGIEAYSHLWLIWQFSKAVSAEWSPTVRPPKLGGNKRIGVFASRSPFRPNNIALSCVKLERLEITHDNGPVLHVKAADLLDGTPIFDVKPYLPYADSYPQAVSGFGKNAEETRHEVIYDEGILELIEEDKRKVVTALLEQDPRPGYQNDPDRIYYMRYCNYDIGFKVVENRILVCFIKKF